MAVPAHDERDFEFAKKFSLDIKQVVAPILGDGINPPKEGKKDTRRNVTQCIIRHPDNGTYLTIKSRKFPWHNFVTGSIEDGENLGRGCHKGNKKMKRDIRISSSSAKCPSPLILDCTQLIKMSTVIL